MTRAAALVTLILVAGPARGEEAPWWAGVTGVFEGEIFSGRGYVKGSTEFRRLPSGGIGGSYVFADAENGDIRGALEVCQPGGNQTLICDWADHYGTGRALFAFTEDLGGFNGLWFTPATPKQGMPWTGKRRGSSGG